MPATQMRAGRGKFMMVVGCVWYLLAFFWLPPLTAICFWLPQAVGEIVLRVEFALSAALAVIGAIKWRRAVGNPKLGTYFFIVTCGVLAVFGVYYMYDWIPFFGGK